MINFVNVYDRANSAVYLYMLLNERPAYANISHKRMPSYEEHLDFFDANPYLNWYLLVDAKIAKHGGVVGSLYVTNDYEVGIFIFAEYQRQGYANQALAMIRAKYPNETLLANIAPTNEASIKLFERNGYKHIQNTYALEPTPAPEQTPKIP